MAETKKMKIGLSISDKNQMKNEIEGKLNESFNLKSKEIDTKLKNQDDTIKGLGKLYPSGTATESEIMAFTSDKGIYIGTDTGNWYYWSANSNIYVSGGAYQSSEDIEQIKKDLASLNEVVISISLPEMIVSSSNFVAKNVTLDGNHYISNYIFGGIGGFTNRKHYKLVFKPSTSGYFTIKSLLSGEYKEIIMDTTYIEANGIHVIDIPKTIDFSDANKYIVFLKGNGYCEDAYLYIYDVSSISDEIISLIDFTTCANPLKYQSLTIPKNTFHNNIVAENMLYGMDASFLGDSLTENGSGGQYITYVKDGLGLSDVHNCGIGGTRVSGGLASGNAFWTDTRVNSLSLNSDVLFIMGGTNDAPYTTVSESDFTIDNHNTDNFVGAYNVLISKVLYKYLKVDSGYYSDIDYSGITQVGTAKPTFRIILITPPKRFDSVANLIKVEQFANYVKKIGALWGLPVVDVNSQMNMNIINKGYYFGSTDLLHFNVNGHRELANIIIGKVKYLN